TMAASCTSSRPVSFSSNASSFFASSRVPSNLSRIFTKARMTNTLTRALPRRSVASPCDQCSPSSGGPARRTHLDRARAIENVRSHQGAVLGESVGDVTGRRGNLRSQFATSTLNGTSRPFDKPKSGRIAVKVLNHLGDDVMKAFKIG